MDLEYSGSKMRRDFEDRGRLRRNYGSYLPGLENRLSELRAADNLAQITHEPPPKRHKLAGNWEGCWGINVTKNHRLVIRPVGMFDPDNLSTVTHIKIEALIDYH